MKKLLILAFALALSACATTNPQQAQVQYVQACGTYGAAFATVLKLRQEGKLNAEQIKQIGLIDQNVSPLCMGPLPTDIAAAQQKITAAITSLAVYEAVQAAQGASK